MARCAVRAAERRVRRRNALPIGSVWHIRSARSDAGGDIAARCPYLLGAVRGCALQDLRETMQIDYLKGDVELNGLAD